MARSEARISVTAWDDDDFIALEPTTQWMYFFLLSQKDLAHTGVLPLRERRWVRKARTLTVDTIQRELDRLAVARFVVVDDDTGELLIRSFIRRDKVYRQPNVLRAAAGTVPQIESLAIRAELLAEMLRVEAADDVPKHSVSIIAEMIEALGGVPAGDTEKGSRKAPDHGNDDDGNRSRNPSPNPSANPAGMSIGNPSVKGSANPTAHPPGERGVVTAVSSDSPFPDPRAVPPPAGDASRAEPDADDEPTAQKILGEYVERCRKRPPAKVLSQLGKVIKEMLAEGIDPDDVRRGVAAWMAKGLHPSALPSVVNEVMNAGARASPSPAGASGLSERSLANLERRRRFAAMDAAGSATPPLNLPAPPAIGGAAS